jgi:hypothetical protein
LGDKVTSSVQFNGRRAAKLDSVVEILPDTLPPEIGMANGVVSEKRVCRIFVQFNVHGTVAHDT